MNDVRDGLFRSCRLEIARRDWAGRKNKNLQTMRAAPQATWEETEICPYRDQSIDSIIPMRRDDGASNAP
jgi:hypothetical protein